MNVFNDDQENFKRLFDAIEQQLGIPHPAKDEEFRQSLINYLEGLSQPIVNNNDVNEFIFDKKRYNSCKFIINNSEVTENNLRTLANMAEYILICRENGYGE